MLAYRFSFTYFSCVTTELLILLSYEKIQVKENHWYPKPFQFCKLSDKTNEEHIRAEYATGLISKTKQIWI